MFLHKKHQTRKATRLTVGQASNKLQAKSSPPYCAKKAFTLIELLVVIAIIGILSSVVVTSLSTARVKSRDSRRVADMKQVQIALELYYDEFGVYPDATATKPEVRFPIMIDELNAKGYLPSAVSDPLDRDPYKYRYVGLKFGNKCKSYKLGAVMEGVKGNEGFLKDDSDDNTVTVASGRCGGGNSFSGISAGCTGTNGVIENDTCYDLKP